MAPSPSMLLSLANAAARDGSGAAPQIESTDPDPGMFAESATAALRLFRRSALCRVLVPTNLAFGLAAAYLNGSFLSAVVSQYLGERAVGAVSAVVVASAAMLDPEIANRMTELTLPASAYHGE